MAELELPQLLAPDWPSARFHHTGKVWSYPNNLAVDMELVITTSESLEWVSFAPAATRGYSRYLSGAFSGSPTVTARYP